VIGTGMAALEDNSSMARLPLQRLLDRITETLVPFEVHFGSGDLSSYDHTDIYDTKLGRLAKQAWARRSRLVFLYTAPLVLLDMFAPHSRKFFASKKVHPICLAHVGLAWLKLAEIRPDSRGKYLALAHRSWQPLQALATATRNGIGWGLNINWETQSGHMPPLSPCHTQTAYVFQFAMELNRIAPSDELLDCLWRIAQHTAYDYIEFEEQTVHSRVTGYSMHDTRPVLNAQSYRLVILLSAYTLFGRSDYLGRALDSLEYLIRWQRRDGAWQYSPTESFIDGYHTCFILKNLVEARRLLAGLKNIGERASLLNARVAATIETGYRYYTERLLDHRSRPIPFSLSNKPFFYLYDAYDVAEAINLTSLFGDFHHVARLIQFFHETMRLRNGLTRFRYYRGISWSLPGISYHRNANTAFFLSAANALNRLSILRNVNHTLDLDGSAKAYTAALTARETG
jgi:hypothetical protein